MILIENTHIPQVVFQKHDFGRVALSRYLGKPLHEPECDLRVETPANSRGGQSGSWFANVQRIDGGYIARGRWHFLPEGHNGPDYPQNVLTITGVSLQEISERVNASITGFLGLAYGLGNPKTTETFVIVDAGSWHRASASAQGHVWKSHRGDYVVTTNREHAYLVLEP